MANKQLRFPNGYRTSSSNITRVKVFPERSLSWNRVYVVVIENDKIVYEGLVELDKIEVKKPRIRKSRQKAML
ncbi:hypothetical protein [Oricola cellulosilytica]|uniref:Uncharacterized protein n=1 Tax=Oricola cellulosilytica TaxID=1429082 RepID=A0A4R0PCD7_9HYPH|nr:hypothetical protein [Oricola cellulosilytica]TCD14128.1 hypothetical protein E0D97_08520 [Oricola cellulosilytica]